MEMKLSELMQAYDLVNKGCAGCSATRDVHVALQQSLELLKKCVLEYARFTKQLEAKEGDDARGSKLE